ncbi:MAG: hypothetical protein ACREDR_34740, partial [Blastocatellia bacterium]
MKGEWIPIELGSCWTRLVHQIEAEWSGSVFDLLCHDKSGRDESGRRSRELQEDSEKIRNWDAFEALISLHAIADEACSGWGIRTRMPEDDETQPGA